MSRRWTKALLGAATMGACAVLLGPAPGWADIKRSGGAEIELRGSDAMLETVRRAAEGYMTEHPEAIITAAGGGAARGFKSVLVGTADIALVTGEIPDELEALRSNRKIQLASRDVFRDAVYVVVNPLNPIADLPLSRVRDVFRGAVTNWKELGGKDAPIVVVNQEAHVGSFQTFKRQVLGDSAVVTPRALTVPYAEFAAAMVETAIGYVGKRGLGSLKALAIDGVSASPETMVSGKYPIQRQLSVAYRADAPAHVQSFVAYLLAPDKGQAIVRAQGDVPVTPTPAEPAK